MTTVQSTTKERPIIMSGESVRAILEGRKTQTRRVVKKSPLDIIPGVAPGSWVTLESKDPNRGRLIRCRYGVLGDRLWVRETFFDHGSEPWEQDRPPRTEEEREARVEYRATEWDRKAPYEGGWTSPIFMPRWASRILLEVTEVRVERVQEITERDASAEGVVPIWCERESIIFGTWKARHRFRDAFREAWDALNAHRGHGWETNPWVWVISFRRLDP